MLDETQGKTTYKYDALNQLTEIQKPNYTSEKYFYDTLGNRVRKENYMFGKVITKAVDYQYNNENQLTEIDGKGENIAGYTAFQPVKFEYDANGNLSKITSGNKTVSQYTFNAENQLENSTSIFGIKTNYAYDGLGKRVKMSIVLPSIDYKKNMACTDKDFKADFDKAYNKAFDCINNKISDLNKEYNYEVDPTSQYGNILMVYGKNTVTQKYTWGNDLISVDRYKAEIQDWTDNSAASYQGKSDTAYYLQDELGSPERIVDERGNTKALYSYDAFGNPNVLSSIVSDFRLPDNIYSYTGYQQDISTGLMFAQARYYMPEVGRFVSEDSYKGKVVNPLSLNGYAYCVNNPINRFDLSGFDSYVGSSLF